MTNVKVSNGNNTVITDQEGEKSVQTIESTKIKKQRRIRRACNRYPTDKLNKYKNSLLHLRIFSWYLFSKMTTIHGMCYFGKRNIAYNVRLIWALLFALCTSFCIWVCARDIETFSYMKLKSTIVHKSHAYPNTSVKRLLPSIVFCNQYNLMRNAMGEEKPYYYSKFLESVFETESMEQAVMDFRKNSARAYLISIKAHARSYSRPDMEKIAGLLTRCRYKIEHLRKKYFDDRWQHCVTLENELNVVEELITVCEKREELFVSLEQIEEDKGEIERLKNEIVDLLFQLSFANAQIDFVEFGDKLFEKLKELKYFCDKDFEIIAETLNVNISALNVAVNRFFESCFNFNNL